MFLYIKMRMLKDLLLKFLSASYLDIIMIKTCTLKHVYLIFYVLFIKNYYFSFNTSFYEYYIITNAKNEFRLRQLREKKNKKNMTHI